MQLLALLWKGSILAVQPREWIHHRIGNLHHSLAVGSRPITEEFCALESPTSGGHAVQQVLHFLGEQIGNQWMEFGVAPKFFGAQSKYHIQLLINDNNILIVLQKSQIFMVALR